MYLDASSFEERGGMLQLENCGAWLGGGVALRTSRLQQSGGTLTFLRSDIGVGLDNLCCAPCCTVDFKP